MPPLPPHTHTTIDKKTCQGNCPGSSLFSLSHTILQTFHIIVNCVINDFLHNILIHLPFIYAYILAVSFIIAPSHNLHPFQISCVSWLRGQWYWNKGHWTNDFDWLCYIHMQHIFIYISFPLVPRFELVGFHVISNDGTHSHAHQLNQSSQTRSCSWVIQCSNAQTWDSAQQNDLLWNRTTPNWPKMFFYYKNQ